MENYLQQILTLFKNVVLNSVGSKRTFLELMEAGDVARAVERFSSQDFSCQPRVEKERFMTRSSPLSWLLLRRRFYSGH